MTHVDLFSGLAGFALAARANGLRTVQFVEIEPHCRKFLSKAWPGVPIHEDIKTFDGRKHRGAFLLSAGVPCQPASRAGKQRGKEDDRWLWGEAIRVLSEVRPAWALFENPPGIGDLFEYGIQLAVDAEGHPLKPVGTVVERDGPGLFYGILEAIEACGYEVQPVSIPACAINAPHERERYWIICRRMAESESIRSGQSEYAGAPEGEAATKSQHERINLPNGLIGCSASGVADTRRLRGGQDKPGRGSGERTADRRIGERMVHSESRGQRIDGSAPRDAGHADERGQGGICEACKGRGYGLANFSDNFFTTCPDCGGSGRMAHSGSINREQRRSERSEHTESGWTRSKHQGFPLWDGFVWLPCADGKVRRAPDDSFSVVAGLHRSVLSALGNSICWPVAAEIISAMIQAEELTLATTGV